MNTRINRVPPLRPDTETPIVVNDPNDPQAEQKEKHQKMERAADHAAHRAAQTEQRYDEDHTIISGSN